MNSLLLIAVSILVGATIVGIPAWYVIRYQRLLHEADKAPWAGVITVLTNECTQALDRIRELERQRDCQITFGEVTPPPIETEEGPELPELSGDVSAALQSIEDPNHREEMAELARYMQSQGVDSKHILTELELSEAVS